MILIKKQLKILIIIKLMKNCSFNKDSQFWTEETKKNEADKKKLSKNLKNKVDITTMTIEEYEIYIDDYTKKSKYPDISK